MKKNICFSFIAACAVTVSGCSMPNKSQVSLPLPPDYQAQPATVVTESIRPVEPVQQPRYLEIEGSDKVEMEEDIESTLPSMIYVNDRIFEYGRKLERWKELDSQMVDQELDEEKAVQMVQCFHELQNVLDGYRQLRLKMLQAQKISTAKKINNRTVLDLQKNDIVFLESGCARLLENTDPESKGDGWSQRQEGADLAQLETLIDRYAENKEYNEILQTWAQIPEPQISRVHLRTKITYGNALLNLNREREAAEIYHQVVEQMSASKAQATDIVSLRKVLADLYTAAGDYQDAKIQYGKISEDYLRLGRLEEWSKLQLSLLENSAEDSPELTDYSSLLQNYLGFNAENDGYTVAWEAEKFLSNYPYSPVSSNVDLIKAATVEDADRWFKGFMDAVEKLGDEKQFKEAMDLLETVPLDILGNEKQIQIKEKNQELLLAIAVERETELMVQMQVLQHQWNSGMLLVKNEKYEDALKVFTDLLDTEYAAKAKQKIVEVSLLGAKADRRKAADLFIRFTKTTDLESKKKLLIESRKLLKNILVKYPDVEIVPKVIGNIERVEQEMTALDPNLIYIADQEEVKADEDMLDAAFAVPSGTTYGLNQNLESLQPVIEKSDDSVQIEP